MNGKRRAKEGASMIIALILLIVFLRIGTSVLTPRRRRSAELRRCGRKSSFIISRGRLPPPSRKE